MKAKIIALAMMASVSAMAQDSVKVDLMPKIGGVLRPRWEMYTDGGLNRFALRNARATIKGKIAAPVDYFVQVDLCQKGKFKFLDGWGRVAILPDLKLKAGQFRIPFGVDTFRGPGNYVFANRSFIGKDVCNVRSAGADIAYSFKFPLSVEAGVFNPTINADESVHTHSKAYSAKAVWDFGKVKVAAGFASLDPDSVRTNITDASVNLDYAGWEAGAEYMYKHYTGNAFDACHAYNLFASYSMPVHMGIFNRLSYQGRWEGVGDHSTATRGTDGLLHADLPAVDRLTLGLTASYIHKNVRCDMRVNYENYFYRHDVVPAEGRNDCVVAELVIVF